MLLMFRRRAAAGGAGVESCRPDDPVDGRAVSHPRVRPRPQTTGVLDLQAGSPIVSMLAELALFAVLFTDGMRVGWTDLRSAWRLPGRALGWASAHARDHRPGRAVHRGPGLPDRSGPGWHSPSSWCSSPWPPAPRTFISAIWPSNSPSGFSSVLPCRGLRSGWSGPGSSPPRRSTSRSMRWRSACWYLPWARRCTHLVRVPRRDLPAGQGLRPRRPHPRPPTRPGDLLPALRPRRPRTTRRDVVRAERLRLGRVRPDRARIGYDGRRRGLPSRGADDRVVDPGPFVHRRRGRSLVRRRRSHPRTRPHRLTARFEDCRQSKSRSRCRKLMLPATVSTTASAVSTTRGRASMLDSGIAIV